MEHCRSGSRSPVNGEFCDLHCCFAEDGKEMYQELLRTCISVILLVVNLLYNEVPDAVVVFLDCSQSPIFP